MPGPKEVSFCWGGLFEPVFFSVSCEREEGKQPPMLPQLWRLTSRTSLEWTEFLILLGGDQLWVGLKET